MISGTGFRYAEIPSSPYVLLGSTVLNVVGVNPAGTDLDIPTLLITAGHTLPALKCTNQQLLAAWPGAIEFHLEEAGHDLWQSHPKRLEKALSVQSQQVVLSPLKEGR